MRSLARDPEAFESAEDLRRRQRTGLIRQVDVGPCEGCDGSGRCKPGGQRLVKWESRTETTGYLCCCGDVDCRGLWNGSHDLVHACDYYETECDCELKETEVLLPVYDRSCAPCRGTGRRYRSGLELAAYCGHEAAREAIGYDNMGTVLGWTQADDGPAKAWWGQLRAEFGQAVGVRAFLPWARRDQIALAKARLIRWALSAEAT